jgi:hypothetical protein
MKFQVNTLGSSNFNYFSTKAKAISFAKKLHKTTGQQVMINTSESLWVPFTAKYSKNYTLFLKVSDRNLYRYSSALGFVGADRNGNLNF